MKRVSLSKDEFVQRCSEGNLIPVYRELLGDTLTPISIFLRLNGPNEKNSFLLESVVQGERLGRYTFIGVGAREVLRGSNGEFSLYASSGSCIRSFKGDPLKFLEEQFRALKPVRDERLPHFFGGAVGFLAYDAVRYYENIPDKNSSTADQEDAYWIFADELIIVDHVLRAVRLVYNVRLDGTKTPEDAYKEAVDNLDRMENSLSGPEPSVKTKPVKGIKLNLTSNLTAGEFCKNVEKAKEYIRAGDIFQVVLSRRFRMTVGVSPFQVYRALRSINPSPYMYYLNVGDCKIVGSSPEILVRLLDGKVVIRPIAGTRRRGRNEAEDKELERDLLSDEKEIAEHIMLVDLGRNDAGRVSVPGSVRLTEFKTIERYSHVMHIVSNCEGILRPDFSPFDALRAALPAGTVSGAPKIRAMEIIDELENVRRGIYAGCVGPVNFFGEFDTAIAIRTLVFKEDVCYLQAGAGIVYDSIPQKECEEVNNKALGLIKAIRLARRGLCL